MTLERVLDRVLRAPEEAGKLELSKLEELLNEVGELFKSEPQLLEVEGDLLLIVGDTHGDLESTLRAFSVEADHYLFLGDYVDRGPMQVENINYLLARKLSDPERVLLFRGNHESPLMNYDYGFYSEVLERYGGTAYRLYARVFASMPYAAVVNGTILATHGGIARDLRSLSDITGIPKGDLVPDNQLALEILWNDPSEEVEFFEDSPRGAGIYLFGKGAWRNFAKQNGIQLMVRAHEYFPEGSHEYFGGEVLSTFSCRYYPATEPKGLLIRGPERKLVSLA